ncbi:PREDICTED: subtilisin-like protease SBT4.15 [Camelina sativa]|uniref:Subtilisin-like protease SBT4.15 n=1 Tax=Camelina sativa TaxID=90675 RepID=A0ABM0Y3Y1_CAMSA|nr:PREDICTED: subtilisin-like protease SBT4.15 [Camelina sativa]
MVSNQHLRLFILCFCFVNTAFIAATEDENNERKPYIVYMGEATENSHVEAAENHHNLLLTVIGDESKAREVKIYSYGKNINGFAARLYPHEAEKLSREDGVVSVFKNIQRQLHTTRSWDFLGFVESKYKRSVALESNIIVGVLDTGIDVDSPSFDDKGVGPPPAKWKGKCVTGNNFTRCNNKVIGAKYFHLDQEGLPDGKGDSPADYDGHGTHTSSTIAGVSVSSASLFGIANGTARGGVPSARIATYKVCWESGCTDMDMLAAFDEAISDGVDVISISIGGASLPFFQDPIAIGAFHAMKRGILTMCSAGNNGPGLFTVSNLAPWVMTVAANSLDRKFETVVKLGNGLTASGISLNGFSPRETMYPLTSGTLASNLSAGGYGEPSTCESGTLGEDKVMGKVVYCEAGREEGGGGHGQDHVVRSLKGAGVIVQLLEPTDMATSTLIAGSYVFFEDGTKISEYINSTKNPQAVIFKTKTTTMVAPSIASFSARGPQRISPNILKPDISAPGLNILAAYSKLASVTGYSDDNRKTLFTIMSGTSMACPHAAAAAAYVKSFHPDWSPAAIKSALMTTATPMRIKGDEAELSYGSGQINPRRAIHPGLVYDITEDAYLRFLCKEGYNSTSIGLLIRNNKNNTTKTEYRCENFKRGLGSDGLNYPSMHKQVSSTDTKVSEVFYRSVTNVGYGPSNYVAKVWAPKGLRVEVVPKAMSFERPGEKKNFKVMIDGVWDETMRGIVSASVEWDDSRGHLVRSPILLFRSGSNYS